MWPPKERLRVAQEVTGQLREMILSGRYRAGEKLPPERKLAESLGINRATLREALKTLEHAGLVRSRQGDGTRVLDFVQTAGLDLLRHLIPLRETTRRSLLRDVLEFRQIIGREVARLAAERARPEHLERLREIAARPVDSAEEALLQDLDFYTELARTTENLVFALLLNTVRGTVRGFTSFFAGFNPAVDEVHAHHLEVIDALAARDSRRASVASDRHLERGKTCVLEKRRPEAEAVVVAGAPRRAR
jgi:DNA-binding FadR family transcriptional regulator